MHHVLNETVDAADLRDHEGSILRLHAKDDAHFQLHRETILGDHLKWIESVGDFAGGPLHGQVCRRNYYGADRERVYVIATRTDHCFLYAAITFRYDVGFVCTFIKPAVRRIAA